MTSAKQNYFDLTRKEIIPFIPTNIKSLLDVGCGEGNFGAEIRKERNIKVWGIEPNIHAAKLAMDKLDNVLIGNFEHCYEDLKEKFDVICFNDVLEHMVDPWRTLELAKGMLHERGTVVASLPNILHFYAIKEILLQKDWNYREKGILDKTHLRFFTKKSIQRMFVLAGFSEIEISGINPVISRGVDLISILSFGYYAETRFPQFVIRAR